MPATSSASTKGSKSDADAMRKALSKYALPSASELRQLQAADLKNTHQSTFFKLQIDQLLNSVTIQPGDDGRWAKWHHAVQQILFKVRNVVDQMGAEQEVTCENLQFPGLLVRNHIKRKEIVLSFARPTRMDVLGSFILKNMAFSGQTSASESEYGTFTVDLAVQMPDQCFLPKDFANYRYFDKRNLYLGVLGAQFLALSGGNGSECEPGQELFDEVALEGFSGDAQKPVLNLLVSKAFLTKMQVKKSQMARHQLRIRVFPVVSKEVFKLSKLVPSKNNIRHDPNLTEQELQKLATPQYNNAILEDMMMKSHTKQLHAAISESESFAQACVLAKVWLRQRGFHRATDSLNGFTLTMVLLYLWRQRRINAKTPCDQIFKVLLQFMATHDLCNEPLMMPQNKDIDDSDAVVVTLEGLRVFSQSFELVFLDASGRFNLFGRVHQHAWKEIQQSAQESMQLINRCTMDDFRLLFIKKNSFWARYDHYFWFPCAFPVEEADDVTYSDAEKQEINDKGLDAFWLCKLTRLVTRALGDRVVLVRGVLDAKAPQRMWRLDQKCPQTTRKVAIGIRVSGSDSALRVVDKGPLAENKQEAAEFRAFWKHRAELRRFKDGTILESVVWEDTPKQFLLETIVRHITTCHCPQLKASAVEASNTSLYSLLDLEGSHSTDSDVKNKKKKEQDRAKLSASAASVERAMTSTTQLWQVFNELAKSMRQFDSLPLKVSDLLPVHEAFRYTNLFPVLEHPLAFGDQEKPSTMQISQVSKLLTPLEVHLRFEKSSLWPMQMQALKHAKTGFYVYLAHEFTRRNIRCEAAREFIDVFLHGYVFRIVIQSEKELGILMSNSLKRLQILQSREFVELKQKCEYAIKHTQNVHALHLQNTSFGPTVRLVQRWLADHLLSNCLRIEAIELLVAHGFVANHKVTSAPRSILSGFLRFLKLVASFDWQQQPLVVNLNSSYDDEKQRAIMKRFEAFKTSSKHDMFAMFIASDYEDMECLSSWTRFGPQRVVVQRLVAVAQRSYDSLVAWLDNGSSAYGWKKAFATNTKGFDAVVKLDRSHLPSKRLRADHKNEFSASIYKNMALTNIPVYIGFDPVQELVHQLEQRFGELAFFFVNSIEQEQIFVTWKPPAFLPRKFRAMDAEDLLPVTQVTFKSSASKSDGGDQHGTKTTASSRQYAVPNVFEVLSEMRSLGQGMIESISLAPFES